VKVPPGRLPAQLAKGLAPVYLISGDEPLQLMEAGDAVRARARETGYTTREVFFAEPGFDWNHLRQSAQSLSLFAERRLLELRLPSGKPGDGGREFLSGYAASPPQDTVLLVITGKLDKGQLSKGWARDLEQAGVLVQVWPVKLADLPAWITRRMQARGMRPTPEAAAMIADRVEGNLLAAAQEIDKLFLLNGPGEVGAGEVLAAVADSSRYDVFNLADTVLAGHCGHGLRILSGLRAEGVAPSLVLWSLTRELRALAGMAAEVARGERPERVLDRHRVWSNKKGLVGGQLRRYSVAHFRRLLLQCGQVDRMIKGAADGEPWDALESLTAAVAGQPLNS
jgi:DNA polymerase-3 subunit delta